MMNNYRQRGRTLVELMIAMTIGLVITALVAGAYLSFNQSSRTSNERSSVEDAGSVVMYLLGDPVRQAGYGEIVGQELIVTGDVAQALRENTLFGLNDNRLRGCDAGGACGIGATPDGSPALPATAIVNNPLFDVLRVRFQGDTAVAPAQSDLRDCIGGAPPTPTNAIFGVARPIIENTYFIVANGANRTLQCQGNSGGASQPLLENIEQFKVFYGFDDVLATAPNGGGVPTAHVFLSAAGVEAQTGIPLNVDRWDYVVSVHVCVVIASAPVAGGGLNVNPNADFTPCPQADANGRMVESPDQATNDGRIRRTYRQVFTVRTNAPPSPFLPTLGAP